MPGMEAVIVDGKSAASVKHVEAPKLQPRSILVRVQCIALNPTDWKHLDFYGKEGTTLGSDFMGTVIEKAPDAGTNVKVGDRVAGMVHGGWEVGVGAFAQYVVTLPEYVVAVPDSMSDEEASGLGVAGITAIFGLFQNKHLSLPEPSGTELPPVDPKLKVLVWSGASSVGQFVIQMARAIGAYVIVTASAKHLDWLKSLGASEVYEYSNSETPKRIAEAHPDLKYAFDTYSMNGSQAACAASMSKTEAGKIVSLLPFDHGAVTEANPMAKCTFLLLYTISGQRTQIFSADFSEEYCKEDAKYMTVAASGKDGLFYRLLSSGLVKPNRTSPQTGGLSGILSGLDRLRHNKVSGEKLVYKIE